MKLVKKMPEAEKGHTRKMRAWSELIYKNNESYPLYVSLSISIYCFEIYLGQQCVTLKFFI